MIGRRKNLKEKRDLRTSLNSKGLNYASINERDEEGEILSYRKEVLQRL